MDEIEYVFEKPSESDTESVADVVVWINEEPTEVDSQEPCDKDNENRHKQNECDQSLMSNTIQEISLTVGTCVQCKQCTLCPYGFTTVDGECILLCQQECVTAFVNDHPGFTVTCKKHVIKEIMPRFLTCSQCKEKSTCYFSYNLNGKDTNYCSMKCLHGMMADEKDKYVFKQRQITFEKITPKKVKCTVCNELKNCNYEMYGKQNVVCNISCIKTLINRENSRYVITKKIAHRKTPEMVREVRERTFLRRCNQCTLALQETKILTWQTMDFCDEVCFEMYQNKISTCCANCRKSLQHKSVAKHCVRFGYDIRQFCNAACLEEFRICFYCQTYISVSHQGFLAPVGDKCEFKDFCSKLCMEKFDQISKKPVPQPVLAKCAVCSLEKATAIEIEVNDDVSQRLCSDPCFVVFKLNNNIFPDRCRWCKKYFERKPSKCYTIYEGSSPHCFCSMPCMNVYMSNSRYIMLCEWCKATKHNYTMIRVRANGQTLVMCSLSCLNHHKESVNAVSSISDQNNFEDVQPSTNGDSGGRGHARGRARGRGRGRGELDESLPDQNNSEDVQPSTNGDSGGRGRTRGRARGRGRGRGELDEPLPSTSRGLLGGRRHAHVRGRGEDPLPDQNNFEDVQPSTNGDSGGRGRARGRARGRGRGRGRGELGEPLPVELVQVRAEKALTKRRLNALPPKDRKEFVDKKRQAELQRVLLPDAPPRKRRALQPSPEREAPVMRDEPSLPEPEPQLEPDRVPPELQPMPAEEELDLTSMDVIVVGQEVDVETSVDVDDDTFAATVTDWLRDGDSDVDLDFEIDENACPLPQRNAAIEPACPTDMTELQTLVLQTEDELNDQLLRDFVTDDDYYHFDWKKDSSYFTGRRETFSEKSGPTFDVTNKTAVDVFYKIFDSGFIDRLCKETNRYAEQKIAYLRAKKKLRPSSRLHRWIPTDRDEIITFLAIMILQGLYPLPDEEKYFSFNGFGTMPYFSRIMSYNRFLLLKSFYHFVDNKALTDKTDKICKIRPVLDYLNEKFSSLYMPSQEIVIDESLLKWHGRLSFSQKIATKAAKLGVKTYELCESRTGYLWKFFIYVGKTPTKTTAQTLDRTTDDETLDMDVERSDDVSVDRPQNDTIDGPGSFQRPTNATAKIVFDLMEQLLNRGHTLIMDNFYNSPLLLRCLKKQKTDCYGTLRLNREFVSDTLKTLTKTDLRQGEVVTSYCPDLSVMVWRDANLVSTISTYHDLQIGTQNKNNRLTYKPKVILDYNKSMGGVDRKDQLLSAHPVERRRNNVWYKKVFCRWLSTAVFNAFIIFSTKNSKITHREFRTVLVEDLLKIHRRIDLTTEPRLLTNKETRKLTKRTKVPPAVDHDHYPARSDIKKARCVMCTRRKRDARTIWKCIQCNVSLCIENCFREYHKTMLLSKTVH